MAHYFPYDVKLRLLADSRSFSANQKARNAIVGAENLLINNNLDLPLEMFIAQMIVGPSKQMKQIFQIEHNIVKNPNWLDANQLVIYKHGRGFELRATMKQIQGVVREELDPGPLDCESDALTTWPYRQQINEKIDQNNRGLPIWPSSTKNT